MNQWRLKSTTCKHWEQPINKKKKTQHSTKWKAFCKRHEFFWETHMINQNGDGSSTPQDQWWRMRKRHRHRHHHYHQYHSQSPKNHSKWSKNRRNQDGEDTERSKDKGQNDPVAARANNTQDLTAVGCWIAPELARIRLIAMSLLIRGLLLTLPSCWTPFLLLVVMVFQSPSSELWVCCCVLVLLWLCVVFKLKLFSLIFYKAKGLHRTQGMFFLQIPPLTLKIQLIYP